MKHLRGFLLWLPRQWNSLLKENMDQTSTRDREVTKGGKDVVICLPACSDVRVLVSFVQQGKRHSFI